MRVNKILIRKATLQDAKALALLGAQSFYESYRYPHNPQDMDAYLKKHFHQEGITKDILNKDIACLVATVNEDIVGFTKLITKGKSPRFDRKLKLIEMKRLYVRRDMIGKKIGLTLMEAALDFSHKENADVIWLSVWENNDKAISFYEKFGFAKLGEGTFSLGETKRTYIVMEKEMSS